MTLCEFNLLGEMEQAKAIWSGTHVATRQDEEHEILLFQIDGFFVEVFFDRTYETISKIEAIGNINQLTLYLDPDFSKKKD